MAELVMVEAIRVVPSYSLTVAPPMPGSACSFKPFTFLSCHTKLPIFAPVRYQNLKLPLAMMPSVRLVVGCSV